MEERARRAARRLAGALAAALLLPALAAGAAASPTPKPPASATPAASASPAAEVPTVEAAARRVRLPARVAEQTLYYAERRGEIEYVLCAEGGKAYEALFVTRAEPQTLYDALARIGLRPGRAAEEADGGRMRPPEGGRLTLTVEWEVDGKPRSAPVEELILDAASGAAVAPVDWFFTGSRTVYDPEHDADVLEALLVGNLVALHHLDRGVLVQRALPRAGEAGRYRTNLKALPRPGTAVTLIFAAAEAPTPTPKRPPASPEPSARPAASPTPKAAPTPKTAPPATRRVHAFVSGAVQGVGFRAFTQAEARRLDLRGWVRNLPDGRVELEAEGAPAALAELERLIHRGPETARVTGVEVREAAGGAGEKLGEFEVRATPARAP